MVGPVIPFGAVVECCPISARDQPRLHQCGKKVPLGIFPGYALIAGRIWKGDTLVADIEELGNHGRIGNISSKNHCKRSIDATKGGYFIFPVAVGTAKLSARDHD